MQAIPSVTPLSRTAFWTSSVMSVRVRPPAVWRRVSCWNTFIVEAILRESLPDSAVEPPHPQWIMRDLEEILGSGGLDGHRSGALGRWVLREQRRARGQARGSQREGVRLAAPAATPDCAA